MTVPGFVLAGLGALGAAIRIALPLLASLALAQAVAIGLGIVPPPAFKGSLEPGDEEERP